METALKPTSQNTESGADSTHLGEPGFQFVSKDPELWFKDGSVILICQTSGFRVNESVLSTNSMVFKDMFSYSSDAGVQLFDGLPAVHLQDDPEDMRMFLMMLYNRGYGRDKLSFSLTQIRGILRVASKYQANHVRNELAEHLTVLFPSSIDDYRSARRRKLLGSTQLNPMVAVETAYDFDLPIILPCALYMSSLLSLNTILRGFPTTDKSTDNKEVAQSPLTIREDILYFREALHGHLRQDIVSSMSFEIFDECVKTSDDSDSDFVCKGLDTEKTAVKAFILRYLDNDDLFDGNSDNMPPTSSVHYNPEPGPCRACRKDRDKFETDFYQPILWGLLPFFCKKRPWRNWSDVRADQEGFNQLWS